MEPEHDSNRSLDQAVAAFNGDPTQALLALGHRYGIAVHYYDRGAIEAHFGRELSNLEWRRALPHLEGYDEWLENSGAAESIDYWLSAVFAPNAGLVDDDGDLPRTRTVETVDVPGELL